MARRGNVTFIANATGSGNTNQMSIDSIPQEIKDEVEEIYTALKTSVDGRMRVEFDTKGEVDQYRRQIEAYCAQRPAGKLRFRKSPTRGLAANVMDFRITDPVAGDDTNTTPATNAPAELPAGTSGGRKQK